MIRKSVLGHLFGGCVVGKVSGRGESPICAHLNLGSADGGAASGMDFADTLVGGGGGGFLSQFVIFWFVRFLRRD